jgi:hypothetical protein
MALVERPADVRRWSSALDEIAIAAYDVFYRRLVSLGYGDTSTWLQALAEGPVEALQCDFAVMLSPTMFEDFVVPQLRRMTDYFPYSLYHLDGTCQLRFLDGLATVPRLRGIQWNPEPPHWSPLPWLNALKEIRRRGWLLHVWCGADDAVVLTRELGPDGLLLALQGISTLDEAQQAIDRIDSACHTKARGSYHA